MNFRRWRAAHLALGRAGERDACRLLRLHGLEILARDWRGRGGELDIVARDGATVVFVEVKTRRRADGFRPAENLSPRQLRRNLRAAREYFETYAAPDFGCRFDLIEVVRGRFRLREIRHYRDFIPVEVRERERW